MARRSIVFKIVRSSDYRIVAITGAYGGMTQGQMMKMDLFADYPSSPDLIEHEVEEQGRLGKETRREPGERSITRDVQIGVMMTVETAERIGNWLVNGAKKFRDQQAKRTTDPKT